MKPIKRIINENIAPGCFGHSNDGFADHMECIRQSWTYGKLSENQRRAVDELLKLVKPTLTSESDYEKDWDYAGDIYDKCLKFVGYEHGQFKSEMIVESKEALKKEIERLSYLIEKL